MALCDCPVGAPIGPTLASTCGGGQFMLFMGLLEVFLRSQCDLEDPCNRPKVSKQKIILVLWQVFKFSSFNHISFADSSTSRQWIRFYRDWRRFRRLCRRFKIIWSTTLASFTHWSRYAQSNKTTNKHQKLFDTSVLRKIS